MLIDRINEALSGLSAVRLSDETMVRELQRRARLRIRPFHDVFWDSPEASVNATLWQHPVGQGFFHSGMIELLGRRPFRYVYDCGKLPGGQWGRLLGPTLTEYRRFPIDALFISHFDNDHINGIGELLDGFGGALRAFLPYLHPSRRLMIAVRETERGTPLTDDYLRFLDSPGNWLADRGVREIIYVGGGEGGEARLVHPNCPPAAMVASRRSLAARPL